MKHSPLKYGFSLWLSACLLAGLSVWSGEVYAQTRKIDKVLETLKKKKEKKKKNKPARKPKGNRGGADVDEAFEPPMERRRPSVGKPLPNPYKRIKAVRKPKKNRDGRKAIQAEEMLMEIKVPTAGTPLPKNDQHYQPELNGKKTMFLKKREQQKQKKIYQGTKKVRKSDISQPGTHYSDRNGGAGKDAEGPSYSGNRKVKKKDISEPGKGQQKSQRAIGRHQQEQGTGFMGFFRKKKRDIHQPGTHHEDRPISLSRQYGNSNEAAQHSGNRKVKKSSIHKPGTHYSERTGGAGKDAEGPTYSGNRKVKKKDISEPGKGQQKSQRAISRHQQEQGTGFMGFFRKKKRDIHQPGTHHEDRPISLSRQYGNSNEAAQHSGNQKVRKSSITKPGTHYSERTGGAGKDAEGPTYSGNRKVKKSSITKPGTHYSERKMSRQDRKNLEASNHAGDLRVKKKHLKEPGTLHSERKAALAKQYSSYEATNFQGHLKAMSKRQRSRFYEKQSRKVHQYEGDIRLRYKNKGNMHPSHVARRAKSMKSAEQVDRYRSFSRWWNRLWSKGQPKAVKEKPAKARYDKNENEIWENSREW